MITRAVDERIERAVCVLSVCHDEVAVVVLEFSVGGGNSFEDNFRRVVAVYVNFAVDVRLSSVVILVDKDTAQVVCDVIVVVFGVFQSLVESLVYERVVRAVHNAEQTAQNHKQKYCGYEGGGDGVVDTLFSDYVHIDRFDILSVYNKMINLCLCNKNKRRRARPFVYIFD